MKSMKRLLSMILALAMILSMAAAMSGCSKDGQTGETEAAEAGSNANYSVSIKSKGGMPLSGVAIYVYADSSLSDLVQYGETDEEGNAVIAMPQSGDYAITLSGVPAGYEVDSYYSFSGTSAQITLTSAPIQGENLSGATLGLGDVMYDFSVTTPGGETVTLSEVLGEKKAVLLNFWYTTCSWCVTEFPYMEQAYQEYIDDIAVIALDPMDQNDAIASFQNTYGLTFPMASCPTAWSATFGISGYPTSILVDRYGVICLIESGAITSLRPFLSMFEHFAADDYEQKLFNGVAELVTNVKPTVEMDTSENIAAILNSGDIEVTYRPETEGEDAEYSWPFVAAEKNGETCLKASNQEIDSSYAILYADISLKAGQAICFDYLVSTERSADILYVIVNDEPIYYISGTSDPEEWQSCYPWVAEEDGTYEMSLCYLKDESTNEGDDTVYIKNMRVVDSSEIDSATYLPRYAAKTEDGFEYEYVDVVLNKDDGYYHVGTKDGPLLLADLMNYTEFNEEKTVWDLAYDGDITVDGHSYYDELVTYFSYASNSALNGVCTVNEELADLLKIVADVAGFDDDENEWLKVCKYYEAYGTDEQLVDPIKGLATYSAYEAKLGKNVSTNYFYYDRPIIPRGLKAEFVPTQSGVYRITSRNDSQDGVEAWIFDENGEQIYVYEQDERMYNDSDNVSMVYYMEAGKSYYIDIAFWDVYQNGYIYYDIEYLGSTYQLFRACAPGYFTYDTNATGEAMYYLITGGIDVVLGTDGYYHEDLGRDANGNQKYGSIIYCDFTGLTSVFSSPIATVNAYNEDGTISKDADGNPVMVTGMIDLGGFDFSKTEDDLYVLAILEKYDYDVEAADAYLHEQWGEDYDANAESYQLEDVYAGKYHGEGGDLTEEISTYLSKMVNSGSQEKIGCVPVDERLAEILQLLMDKYTFEDVDNSWIKICYYYDYLGPEG